MKLLLDTHAFLWAYLGDARLSSAAAAAIADPQNALSLSAASYWEIAIKVGTSKYTTSVPFEDFFTQGLVAVRATVLHVELRHAAVLTGLPSPHKDPFDRMIAAQALADGLTLVSADIIFDSYNVNRL